MKKFKMRCIKPCGNWFTEGKIYEVVNGCFVDDHGFTYGRFFQYKSIDDINRNFDSQFELVEEKFYIDMDITLHNDEKYMKMLLNSSYGTKAITPSYKIKRIVPISSKPQIQKVIFNNPATIVMWSDGTKTVVKAQENDIFDPEKGLAMAISKKVLGNQGNYYEEFKKWLPEEKEEEYRFSGINADEVIESLKKYQKMLRNAFDTPKEIKKSCDNCKYREDTFENCRLRKCIRAACSEVDGQHVDAWESKEVLISKETIDEVRRYEEMEEEEE